MADAVGAVWRREQSWGGDNWFGRGRDHGGTLFSNEFEFHFIFFLVSTLLNKNNDDSLSISSRRRRAADFAKSILVQRPTDFHHGASR